MGHFEIIHRLSRALDVVKRHKGGATPTPKAEPALGEPQPFRADAETTIRLLALLGQAHRIAAAHGAPQHVLDILADPLRATDAHVAVLSQYGADGTESRASAAATDPLAVPVALRAAGGSMEDFKAATDLVGKVTGSGTFGQALALVLAYRMQVRRATLEENLIQFVDGRAEEGEPTCWCHRCNEGRMVGGLPYSSTTFIVCPDCGNKRCPKASNHALVCTRSNEPGQPGSVYGPPERGAPIRYRGEQPDRHAST